MPRHTDVEGNERADRLAKLATSEYPSSDTTSLAMLGLRIKQVQLEEWTTILLKYSRKQSTS